ncbi:MAG: pilin [Patescibacteria group bacterium]|nr:pilin [Patescibacteria group bacterium]
MLKKYFKKIILAVLLFSLAINFCLAQNASAGVNADLRTQLNNAGRPSWGSGDVTTGANSLSGIMATGIKAFLGLLGIIFLVLIIYAGFLWMTAQGDEEKVTKAKDTITRAVIGLVIIILAYSITYFVFSNLPGSAGAGTGATGTSGENLTPLKPN